MGGSTHIVGIVPAGGDGARFGSPTPKLLLMLGERSVIEHSVNSLLYLSRIREVVVPVPEAHRASFDKILSREGIRLCAGGKTRSESVSNALALLAEDYNPERTLVVIHDGARPLTSSEDMERVIEAAEKSGAAVLGNRITDTVKMSSEEGTIVKTLDRSSLWAVQTPQVFRLSLLIKHIGKDSTDEATLIEDHHAVTLVEGSRYNIKITTKEDLDIAKRLI